MPKKRSGEEQIAFALRQADAGTAVGEICRKMGVAEATFYRRRKVYAGMGVSEIRRLKQLENENGKLKRLAADLTLDKTMLQDVLRKKGCRSERGRRADDGLAGIVRAARMPEARTDGNILPAAIFDAIRRTAAPDYIAIADSGDLLSVARVGIEARTCMDAGAFGCLGVGVPFAVAAALAFPDRQVISINGDGAFGINAMEIDTAVRHGAKAAADNVGRSRAPPPGRGVPHPRQNVAVKST